MTQGITNQVVKRIFEYPNNDHKRDYKAQNKYGLTELHLEDEKQWLFVHNKHLYQVDIIDVTNNEHLHTFSYQEFCPSMKVHKGVDLCQEKKWLILGGEDSWLVWNYETHELVQSHCFNDSYGTNIVSAKISPNLQELWVLIEDQDIIIYSTSTWKVLDKIKVSGSYSFPLVWHPDGKHFLFTQMEQGGTDVYVGNITDRTIDRTKSIFSNSYIIANLIFSADGQYILMTDAGVHIYKFPSLEQCYSLDDYTKKTPIWESPQYPEEYSLVNPFLWKEYQNIMLILSDTLMALFPINGNEEYFYFIPLERLGYETTIEGIIGGTQIGIFYFSDYLGGIYSLDISEAMQAMID